jgi:hypothetical protein
MQERQQRPHRDSPYQPSLIIHDRDIRLVPFDREQGHAFGIVAGSDFNGRIALEIDELPGRIGAQQALRRHLADEL